MRVHHLGYLVKDMQKALKAFHALGYDDCESPLDGIVHDGYREIYIAFIEKDGYRIELIAPDGKESKMYPMLKRHRNDSYHICYESDDLAADLKELAAGGWSVVDELAPAPAIEGKGVCFLMNPSIGMIELIDESGQGR